MNIAEQLTAALASRYLVEREVGAGGMATVYLARDLRHDRQVALKVLHPDLAAALGAERFLAEIRTTANLQHPHILPLHDSGEAGGYLFYVMPFVAGETLRARVERVRQLPIPEALRIATETLSALDYAHRHGVIHRDIKPENILLHDESALVADFGIALAVSAAGGQRMTQTGLSLGTPQYMSPEQAMGDRHIDGRADIYAVGAVVYEMLTGEPPFSGASVQAIVAKLMTERPTSPRTVRDTIPPHVESAVVQALAKLPADRFATAKEFSDALSDPRRAAPSSVAGARGQTFWRGAAIGAGALAAAAIGAFAWAVHRGATATGGRVERFILPLPVEPRPAFSAVLSNYGRTMDASADGSRIVYVGRDSSGFTQLFVRDLSLLDSRPLPGTRGVLGVSIAPDGSAVAFLDGTSLRVASLGGAGVTTLVQGRVHSVFWCRDGKIYYTEKPGHTIVSRMAPSGGASEKMLDYPKTLTDMVVLPDGRAILASISTTAVNAISFADGKPRPVVAGTRAAYSAAGYVVYIGPNQSLMAAPFDATHLTVTADPVTIAQPGTGSLISQLAVADDGSLLYESGFEESSEFVWVRRDGSASPLDSALRGSLGYPALSRDGKRLVYSKGQDVWTRNLVTGASAVVAANANYAAWKPDGHTLSYYHQDSTGYRLWQKDIDNGTPEKLLVAAGNPVESTWSPDGTWLIYRTAANAASVGDVLAIRPGTDAAPTRIAATPAAEVEPAVSFDGHWLAYVSDESGREEVYVVPFPNAGAARWMVSTEGGSDPLWSHSGNELFFRDATGNMVSVAVSTSPTFSAGVHRRLFSTAEYRTYAAHSESDLAPDDQRFLMVRRARAAIGGRVVLVRNWANELRGRAVPP